MGMADARPERVKSFEPALPCIECGHCRVKDDSGAGWCVQPDIKSDSRGPIPEPIDDVYSTDGACGGFVYRSRKVVTGQCEATASSAA